MKINYTSTLILILFFSFSVFSQEEVDDKIEDALNNTSITIRGKISEENGAFCLHYYDIYEKDSHAEYLKKRGFHGGGPSWLAIIYAAFNIFEPNIIDTIDFEPQVSGVTFTAKNKEDLEMIGRVISLIKSDEAVMSEMIARAQQLEVMK